MMYIIINLKSTNNKKPLIIKIDDIKNKFFWPEFLLLGVRLKTPNNKN